MLSKTELNSAYQYAYTLCQDPQDASDLLQAALEKYLIEVKRKQRCIDNPVGFVRTLIRHRCIDLFRQRQRWFSEAFEEGATYDISPIDLEKLYIDGRQLQQIWQQLSPGDRDILYHWAVLGYSTDEACEQLGIPRGTLLSRIHRLRKALATGSPAGNLQEDGS